MAKSTRARAPVARVSPTTLAAVSRRLAALDGDSNLQAARLRAFAASILALMPADPGAHPALKTQPTMPAALHAERWELREALGAVRTLADAIEDAAWRLQADMAMGLTDIYADLGIERGAA